ncbi:proline dehydrogenase family protein [Pseudofrankia inefficax]|uniref:proline dehydrogenase n=1 Tax=Pseudofrankia inefficax (strain DSM 45817 / CECT 9037 / DDB 130130 / EuI1c) TaxID=298654 RepID=E3IY87_PSEI1|nr:proline dehydrogenase family protein [Pseudofrankia inefficax]ADP82685.1 Proline dehydrogenase [Pseudofrankia inefficax]
MIRRVLLAASRSARAREFVVATPVTRRVVDRFVAGERPLDALEVVRGLAGEGILATVDRLGERGADLTDAREATTAYLGLLDLAEDAGLAAGLDVSVKLSALGRLIPCGGWKICYDNAAEICARAAVVGATVTLDAEEHTTIEPALRLLTDLRRDHPATGAVLQAYLRRTEDDCRRFAVAGARVRLCKGAYRAPRDVAWTHRPEADAAYARCLRILMAGDGYPMVATHDPSLLALAERLAEEHGRAASSFEYQLLHGIRPHEQLRLASIGAQVRVYLPYGPDWYPYLLRRMAERPANLALFLRALRSQA